MSYNFQSLILKQTFESLQLFNNNEAVPTSAYEKSKYSSPDKNKLKQV